MYSAFEAVAQGIGAQENAMINSQVSTARFAIFMVGAVLSLQKEWMKTLVDDANQYMTDTLLIPQEPWMAAQCSIDSQQKTMDTNESDVETGNENNLIASAKAQEEFLGSSLDMVFGLEQPIFDFMNLAKSLIRNL